MTDVEFASCDLEKYNEVYNNPNRKKFSELKFGDPIYCAVVTSNHFPGIVLPQIRFYKYEMQFNRLVLVDPTNKKSRKAKIYVTDTHGFIADKNVTAFMASKRIVGWDKYIQVYGTSLEECIYKTERITGWEGLESKFVWKEPLYGK